MEITQADSNSTELTDRILWFDGDSTVDNTALIKLIMTGAPVTGLCVDKLSPEIIQYNNNVRKSEKINIKESLRPLSFDWNIPQEYKDLDIEDYIHKKMHKHIKDLPDKDERIARVEEELKLYKQLDLMDAIAMLIYMINTLIKNNVVWGVGRGSSVSSYILYLIGVHDIDSYKYELNIREFLRTE